MSDDLKLKIPSDTKMVQITEVLGEDEDWRFGRIKIDGKKPRFELPAPTKDEPDNVEIEKMFYGVVLVAKKNFYQSDEAKEAGEEPKEKRALYILRVGKYMPELMYVSPTAIRNWKYFAKEIVTSNRNYYEVLCEFSAEQIRGKQFTWSKPTFKIARTLTEAEAAHVQILRELVLARAKEYEDNKELDKYEDTALSVDRGPQTDDIKEEDIPKARSAAVEDDTPDAPVTKKEEAKPKEKKKAKKDDDDDDEKPVSKGRTGYPDLDDDDDDLSDVGKKTKPVDDDD